MDDKEIEKIINEEYGEILDLTDEEIKKLSFIESCIYLEKLNQVNKRIKELKEGF